MMSIDETRPEPNILLVEDNPIDVLMIKRALRNSGFKNQPIVLDDGEPALAFLGERINVEAGALPDLVILDLNLRKVDGPEVLSYIRGTPELKDLRVILLSSMPEDLMKEKTAEADCYIEKPDDVTSFLNLGERIRSFYWDAAKTAGA
jgi:CheY-like chemotaxis protein